MHCAPYNHRTIDLVFAKAAMPAVLAETLARQGGGDGGLLFAHHIGSQPVPLEPQYDEKSSRRIVVQKQSGGFRDGINSST